MLRIGVDAGFDFIKIVSDSDTFVDEPICGLFKFPFNVFQITDETFRAFKYKPTFMCIVHEMRTFLVGEYARNKYYDKCSDLNVKEQMGDFYSINRFKSEDFKKGILAAIGSTIISKHRTHLINPKNEELPNDITFEETVLLQIAVPVALVEDLAPFLSSIFKGVHAFSIELGAERQRFSIKANISVCNVCPQAIAALVADTSDDDGCLNDDMYESFFKFGSILLLDNGYGTLGEVPISAEGTIDPSTCDSTYSFTMKYINEKVSKLIDMDYGKDFPHYTIENIINTKNGMVKDLNVKEIKDSVLPGVATEMVQYLSDKYNHLDVFDAIALAGGTSNTLKPHLIPLLAPLGFTEERVKLVTPILRGQNVPVEYAVAAGAYKMLGDYQD